MHPLGDERIHAVSRAPLRKRATTMDHIIIELDDIVSNTNVKPFKNILKPPKERTSKKVRSAKTLENTRFYLFSAEVGGAKFFKIGETGDNDTYHSKGRYCPWQEYKGVLQVQHYGRVIERLLKVHLRESYKKSEWYVNCEPKLVAFERALALNEVLQPETPIPMTNVTEFEKSFTGRHKSTLDDYLKVFRVRYRSQLYVLTSANIELPMRELAVARFRDTSAPVTLGPVPRAPAAPAAPPPSPVPVPRSASSSLAASVVLNGDEGDDDDDDDDEEAEESSSSSHSSEKSNEK
jgi:hypothetical protein